jgi:hypothetical protein
MFSFDPTILLRSSWARKLRNDTLISEKIEESGFTIFHSIITTKNLNNFRKLGLNNFGKVNVNLTKLEAMFHQI